MSAATTQSASAATTVAAVMIVSTAPDEATARQLARGLLEARVAACVNLVPGVRSMYRWQGAIEEADEWVLLIKTERDLAAQAQALLAQLHPYEVPESIVVAIESGSQAYLDWIHASVS